MKNFVLIDINSFMIAPTQIKVLSVEFGHMNRKWKNMPSQVYDSGFHLPILAPYSA